MNRRASLDVLGLQFSPGERRGSLTRRMSNGFVELKEEAKDVYHAVRPSRRMSNADVDVLGMPKTPRAGVETPRAGVPISDSSAPLPPSAPPPETPREGEPMLGASSRRDSYVATSDVLHEDENDWAAEALLLTHEPMRRDMATMNECLEVRFFGALPESWRVRAFFRFFSGWSALISQHHAVEAAVLCDYLAEPTGGLPPNYRQELLEYQRGIEVKAVAVGRMEAKILHELTQAADWTTSEPVSQCAEELRELVGELCEEVLSHLDEQEALLPPLLRAFWGQSSPPLLLVKSMEAAKASGLKGHRPQIFVKLLSWIVYYLQDRDPTRARWVVRARPALDPCCAPLHPLATPPSPRCNAAPPFRPCLTPATPGTWWRSCPWPGGCASRCASTRGTPSYSSSSAPSTATSRPAATASPPRRSTPWSAATTAGCLGCTSEARATPRAHRAATSPQPASPRPPRRHPTSPYHPAPPRLTSPQKPPWCPQRPRSPSAPPRRRRLGWTSSSRAWSGGETQREAARSTDERRASTRCSRRRTRRG